MSKEYVLSAEVRSDEGKGASRRLRREGGVPAVVYGGKQDAQSITLRQNEIARNLQDEAFYSSLLTLDVAGEKQTVVLRDLQRHPAKELVMHVDLQRVVEDELIRVNVPLHFLNVAASMGVKTQGGVMNQVATSVLVEALPKDIPGYLEVDMQEVEKGQIVHLSDIQVSEGVVIPQLALGADHDQAVAAIH